MLELHATPLMWATILLLSFVCLWWFIVEWGFKKPTAQTHTASNDKSIDNPEHATRLNTNQQHKAKETGEGSQVNTKTRVKDSAQGKVGSKSQKPTHPQSTSTHSTRSRKSNPYSGTKKTTNTSGNTSANNTTDHQARNLGKLDGQTSCISAATVNDTTSSDTHTHVSHSQTKKRKSYGKQQTFQSTTNTPKATVQQTNPPASQQTSQSGRPEAQSHKTSAELQESDTQSNNQRKLKATVSADQRRTHSVNAKTNLDNKTDTIEPKAAELETSTTDNAKHKATANQVAQHNARPSDAMTPAKLHQVESNQTQLTGEKTKQPTHRSTRLDTQLVNATSQKATVDRDNFVNKKPPTTPKTSNPETGSDKQSAELTTPRYQTAAKARHPSSRSEASLQIPTPTAHGIDSSHTETSAQQHSKARTSAPDTPASQFITTDSNQVLSHTAATLAGSIKPNHKLHPNNKTHQNSGTNTPIPFEKIQARDAQRKQSSIEVAVAQQITDPQSQPSRVPRTISVDEVTTTSSFSAKISKDVTAKSPATGGPGPATGGLRPTTVIPDIDTDASLRAQLAANERQIKSLQSTLNSVQHNLPTTAAPATRTPLQHSRPSLLSKVRVLDQPKA